MRSPGLLLSVLLLAAVLLPGCIEDGDAPPPAQQSSGVVEAPWWPVGAYWDIDLTRGTGAPQHFRLVHFWNDSETNHFWLGVADRRIAMDMALNDTNPLLGRIHWRILTPHESGIHALGMFTFPTEPEDTFGGLAFGKEWEITVKPGKKPGGLSFEGTATDKSTLAYDYDPDLQWFSFVSVKDRSGANVWDVKVKGHGTDAKGTYTFLRGRDYYEGPEGSGTHTESFEVKDEGEPHKSLALYIDGTVSGPLAIEVRDSQGTLRHSETLAVGSIKKLVELPTPRVGTWQIRYTGTGTLSGKIEAVGILEYSRTL